MNLILEKFFEGLLKIKIVFAQYGGGGPGSYGGGSPGGGEFLPNPLGQGTDIYDLLNRIAFNYLLPIAAPIAVIMIIYGAFQILTAAGDVEKVKTGRKTIIYAAVGLGIVLLSTGIVAIIKEILGAK